MKLKFRLVLLTAVLFLTLNVVAATRYVNLNNATPVSPYTNWPSAATNIQAAIDVATNGDLILVTNGVYQTGGQVPSGTTLTNRVAVTRAVTIQSVNGPNVTVIQGNQVAGTTNGIAAIRCVYLTNGAFLSGFTLTNGATRSAGLPADTKGGGLWCVSTNAAASNCVVVGNAAFNGGGGTFQGTLVDCTLTGNSAGNANGGGAQEGILRHCTLTWNRANFGGGASSNLLIGCVVDHNTATNGGGAYRAVLNNCTLTGNVAVRNGGGAYQSALGACPATGNSAYTGGGAYSSTLTNCTLTGNSAFTGGGVSLGTADGSIVYFNTAQVGPNFDTATLNYCCTLPLPTSGTHNLILNPQLASNSHLSADSPCRGAGSVTNGTDIDGEAWLTPPAIGCDEYRVGSLSGPLNANANASSPNVAAGFPLTLTATITGRTAASLWDFGDGTIVSNQPYAAHVWVNPGDYTVVLSAFNETQPGGVNSTQLVHVLSQPVHYVAVSNTTPSAPYDSWATAATNIQDAVDAAAVGALVLVSNGVYQSGGRAIYTTTNRVTVDKPLIVRSVNGPQFTWIQGKQVSPFKNGPGAIRCVYLAAGSTLSGFTLFNGATESLGTTDLRVESGGGVWCAAGDVLVTNCVLSGNSAFWRAGGAFFGTLSNCSLVNNTAIQGGGVSLGTLNNCSLINNSVTSEGGGAYQGTFTNCLLMGNSANLGGATSQGIFSHCTFASNNASLHGGGAYLGSFYDCNFSGNSAPSGVGGATEVGLLYRCTLTGNSAAGGGGADSATLYDCVLTGNTAVSQGGGASYTTINNCTITGNSSSSRAGGVIYSGGANNIVYFNSAPLNPNWDQGTPGGATGGALQNSCTTPVPDLGAQNITNAPLFVDYGGGDFHLSSNSPCINAGYQNGFTATDRDGNPRPVGGTADIGAYEFQTPASVLSYAWAQQFGLAVDGSADYADTDGDQANNWQEWKASTVPIDASSVLAILTVFRGTGTSTVTWQSVTNVTYYVQRSTNLAAQPAFVILKSNLNGQATATSYMDTSAVGVGPYFYRIGVQ